MTRFSKADVPLDRVFCAISADIDRHALASALAEAGFHETLGYDRPQADDTFLHTAVRDPSDVTIPAMEHVRVVVLDYGLKSLRKPLIDAGLDQSTASVLWLMPPDDDQTDYADVAARIERNPDNDWGAVATEVPGAHASPENIIAERAFRAAQTRRMAPDRVRLWFIDDERSRYCTDKGWWGLLEQWVRAETAGPIEVIRSLATGAWLAEEANLESALDAWLAHIVVPAGQLQTFVVSDNQFGSDLLDLGERWVRALADLAPTWKLWVLSNKDVPLALLDAQTAWLDGPADRNAVAGKFRSLLDSIKRASSRPDVDVPLQGSRQASGVGGGGSVVSWGQLVARSQAMRIVFDHARSAATVDSTVVILGPTGTGKSELAEQIHAHSLRKAGHFVELNCGAFPGTLLASELFGHVRGAFTGAHQDKKGAFQAANGGTLFLDEIGDMPPAQQVALNKVIEDGAVRPVGATAPIPVDVRVIAATWRDLLTMVGAGEFREDLWYRLNVLDITIPPLKDRREDILPIAEEWLRGKRSKNALSPLAAAALEAYDWPGNVRELCNKLERAVASAGDGEIQPRHLGLSSATISDLRQHLARYDKARFRALSLVLPELAGSRHKAFSGGARTFWRRVRGDLLETVDPRDRATRCYRAGWLMRSRTG